LAFSNQQLLEAEHHAGTRQCRSTTPLLLRSRRDGDHVVDVGFLGQRDGTDDLTKRRVVDRCMALGSIRHDLSTDVMADHGRASRIFNAHRVFAPFTSNRHGAQGAPQAFDHFFALSAAERMNGGATARMSP
jgi:hypothetical protein